MMWSRVCQKIVLAGIVGWLEVVISATPIEHLPSQDFLILCRGIGAIRELRIVEKMKAQKFIAIYQLLAPRFSLAQSSRWLNIRGLKRSEFGLFQGWFVSDRDQESLGIELRLQADLSQAEVSFWFFNSEDFVVKEVLQCVGYAPKI